MVKFEKLVKGKRKVDLSSLTDLFESLDRQASHTELRNAQREALQSLGQRRQERNVVLKMSTGTGKTAVALLYLYSHMEEKNEPVVYLCPTVQLVEQVQQEASKLGIKSVIYAKGEPHPAADGSAAKAIIICTYAKLFNAKTTFDRTDVLLRPCSIVLDDAHAGVEEVRSAFTLHISGDELHDRLLALFGSCLKDLRPGIWKEIQDGDPTASLELPYWLWRPILGEATTLIAEYSGQGAYVFVWPFLREITRWCRCIIAGTGIEIVPTVLPVEKIKAFSEAGHLLFMSATLADDSVLIRELGCDVTTALKPILPTGDKGLGERMVLAPSLVDKSLHRKWVMGLCGQISKHVRIVVLSPSETLARQWESFGAMVVLKDQISTAVKALRDSTSNYRFVVFVQRYDGVDLPDDSCRVLVIDGMPYGEGIADRYDNSLTSVPGRISTRLVYRLEQGMGRAVRSYVDYAVIVLAGPELANFIARRDVLTTMNPDTRAQLGLALHLAKLAIEEGDDPGKAVVGMLKQCLERDEGWKQFYNENVREADHKTAETDETHLLMARAEREAFQAAVANDPARASEILSKALNDNDVSEKSEGWYFQNLANYMFDSDPGKAFEVQRSAYAKNNTLLCPPSVMKRPISSDKQLKTEISILKWFSQFDNPNGAIAAIQELRAQTSYEVRPETMEQAIMNLASLVGAEGVRPEKQFGEGPDDLWLWPSISLVIEAKNQNEESLHKKDAGQLLLSLQWFQQNYPARKDPVPVIVAEVTNSDSKAGFPPNTRVLTPTGMKTLLDAVEAFYRKLITEKPLLKQPGLIGELLKDFRISPDQFVVNYTDPVK